MYHGVIFGLHENIIISETIHDRSEVTIEHTLEVIVAYSVKQKPPPISHE